MTAFNVLKSIPDVAAIDQSRLQVYCNEWVVRPIARKFGFGSLLVDSAKNLQLIVDSKRFSMEGDFANLPFDQLVAYIIDRHFADPDERRKLHAQLCEVRHKWPQENYGADVAIGRVGTIYIVCKNPACVVWIETSFRAAEGQTLNSPPAELTCPACGVSDTYNGTNCRVRVDDA